MTDPTRQIPSDLNPDDDGLENVDNGKEPEVDDDLPQIFAAYLEYNRILRTWFVAFGIGGPALFLVHEKIATRLLSQGYLHAVVVCFLIGAAAQVGGALVNKIGNWVVYYGSIEPSFCDTKRFKVAEWLLRQFWIDVLLDLVTVATFGRAVWWMLTLFGDAS